MGAGTREAERLAEEQNKGPFLVLFDVGGGVGAGMFTNPTLAETLEDVQAHVEAAEKASDGNVTVRSIKLRRVLAAPQLAEALKGLRRWAEEHRPECTCDMEDGCGYYVWNDVVDPADAALAVAGEEV